MSWSWALCLVPECDRCGQRCWGGGQLPHFSDGLDQARQTLISDWEWEFTPDAAAADGEQMLCADCAAAAACDRDGHRWQAHHLWQAGQAASDLRAVSNLGPTDAHYRLCERCAQLIPDPAATGRHPESITAELAEVHEEALAELDAQLWPQAAGQEGELR